MYWKSPLLRTCSVRENDTFRGVKNETDVQTDSFFRQTSDAPRTWAGGALLYVSHGFPADS